MLGLGAALLGATVLGSMLACRRCPLADGSADELDQEDHDTAAASAVIGDESKEGKL